MQSDEEVGKVAAPVPVIISRALELFAEALLKKANSVTAGRGARTLTPSHLKSCIHSEARFDFLRDMVASVPELQGDVDCEPSIHVPIPSEGMLGRELGSIVQPSTQLGTPHMAPKPKASRGMSQPRGRGSGSRGRGRGSPRGTGRPRGRPRKVPEGSIPNMPGMPPLQPTNTKPPNLEHRESEEARYVEDPGSESDDGDSVVEEVFPVSPPMSPSEHSYHQVQTSPIKSFQDYHSHSSPQTHNNRLQDNHPSPQVQNNRLQDNHPSPQTQNNRVQVPHPSPQTQNNRVQVPHPSPQTHNNRVQDPHLSPQIHNNRVQDPYTSPQTHSNGVQGRLSEVNPEPTIAYNVSMDSHFNSGGPQQSVSYNRSHSVPVSDSLSHPHLPRTNSMSVSDPHVLARSPSYQYAQPRRPSYQETSSFPPRSPGAPLLGHHAMPGAPPAGPPYRPYTSPYDQYRGPYGQQPESGAHLKSGSPQFGSYKTGINGMFSVDSKLHEQVQRNVQQSPNKVMQNPQNTLPQQQGGGNTQDMDEDYDCY